MRSFVSFFLCGAALLTGCVQAERKPDPPKQKTVTVQLPTPKFTLTEPKEPGIKKEGLLITIQPVSYEQAEERKVISVQQTDSRFDWTAQQGKERTLIYTVTRAPVYRLQPDIPKFLVKVNNSMDRVFRFAGAVITYQINGKQAAVPQTSYQSVLGGIVTPRGEAEFELTGPGFKELGQKCTLGLFLYDVVIETDAAGTPTKKANFEWVYSYEVQQEARQASVTSTLEEDLKPEQLQAYQEEARQAAGK